MFLFDKIIFDLHGEHANVYSCDEIYILTKQKKFGKIFDR